MESIGAGEQIPEPIVPSNRRRRQIYLIVALIAASLILVVVVPALSNPGHQILKAGDYLEYSVSGFSNNTTFTSVNSFTIFGADELSVSCIFNGGGYPMSAGDIPEYDHDFYPYEGDLHHYGEPVGTEEISTPFGTKCVKVLYHYEGVNDEVVLADVGVDSYLVYRWTVSCASGAYHYTYELTATNNTRVSSADTVMRPLNIQVLNTPAPTPCTSFSMYAYPPGPGVTMCWGSVEIGQGQQLHYILGGTSTTMYVFGLTDLLSIDATGQFRYNSSLSRLPGNPGETNITAEPGIYWFVALYNGSNDTVDFNGQQVGGYLIPYFGLKGQEF